MPGEDHSRHRMMEDFLEEVARGWETKIKAHEGNKVFQEA